MTNQEDYVFPAVIEQPIRVINRNVSVENRDTIPIDRRDSLLRTVEHMEIQAGRLLKMARDVRIALTTK